MNFEGATFPLKGYTIQVAIGDVRQKRAYTNRIQRAGGRCVYTLSANCIHGDALVVSNPSDYSNWPVYQKEKWRTWDIRVVSSSWVENVLTTNQILPITPNDIINDSLTKPIASTTDDCVNSLQTKQTAIILSTERQSYVPSHKSEWEVAKISAFKKNKQHCRLEVQVQNHNKRKWRIAMLTMPASEIIYSYVPSVIDVEILYENQYQQLIQQGYTKISNRFLSYHNIASFGHSNDPKISEFIQHIYENAISKLSHSLHGESRNTAEHCYESLPPFHSIVDAEALIVQLETHSQKFTKENAGQCTSDAESQRLLQKLKKLLPKFVLPSIEFSCCDLQEQIQLMKDVYALREEGQSVGSLLPTIRALSPQSTEFQSIESLVLSTMDDSTFTCTNVFDIDRISENTDYLTQSLHQQLLFHGTRKSNILGILTRGLMVPYCHKTWNTRIALTLKEGLLGKGIYFSDRASTSLKYCSAGNGGKIYLVICQVALGSSYRVYEPCIGITKPPDGFDSLHAIPRDGGGFTETEYCIYTSQRQKLRYIIELTPHNENASHKETITPLQVSALPPLSTIEEENDFTDTNDSINPPTVDSSTHEHPEQLTSINQAIGLISAQNERNLFPLKRTECKVSIIDMIAQVNLFFVYQNESTTAIEAKFVFPLAEHVAVCDFECYINDKHLIGIVKEKQQARTEYAKALEEDHSAFLLEQHETHENIWTVAVGNLPPKASVVMKVSYVSELCVDSAHICFELPCYVSDLEMNSAMRERFQATHTSLSSQSNAIKNAPFALSIGIEMANVILSIESGNQHEMNVKQTDTKAFVALKEPSLHQKAFQLLITTENMFVPRMWLEESTEGTYAAMISLFPNSLKDSRAKEEIPLEIIVVVDCSSSMKENEELLRVTLSQLFNEIEKNVKKEGKAVYVNVLSFGAYSEYLFPSSKLYLEVTSILRDFGRNIKCNWGGTKPWEALHSVLLLDTVERERKIVLLTDGQFGDVTEQIIYRWYKADSRSRLFVLGMGENCLRHTIHLLARCGGGHAEFLSDVSCTTRKKLSRFVGCLWKHGLRNVSVCWGEDSKEQEILSTPSQIVSLFEGERQVVYCLLGKSLCTSARVQGQYQRGHEVIEDLDMRVYCPELCMRPNSSVIHSLAAKSLIQDYESDSCYYADDIVLHTAKKASMKRVIIDTSIRYHVGSKFTSFLAIEERQANTHTENIPLPIVMKNVFSTWLERCPNDPIPEMDFTSNNYESLLSDDFWNFASSSFDGDYQAPVIKTKVKRKKLLAKKKPISSSLSSSVLGTVPLKKTSSTLSPKAVTTTSSIVGRIDAASTLEAEKKRTPPPMLPTSDVKPVIPRAGTGAATRLGVLARNKLFCTKGQMAKKYNEKISRAGQKLSPFGFLMPNSPPKFGDHALSYLLKGPLNKLRGGNCWLDATLALALTVVDDWKAFSVLPIRKVPSHFTPAWAREEPISVSLCRFFLCWIHCSFDSFCFRKELSTAHNILWMKFEEHGFDFGGSHCVIKALEFLLPVLSLITNRHYHLLEFNPTTGNLVFPPVCGLDSILICINREYSAIKVQEIQSMLSNYQLHSFITFENILSSNDGHYVNHYMTLALDSDGYYIYDDLLNLPQGNWQGGFVSKSIPCYKTNLIQFLGNVPIFILKNQENKLAE